MGSFIKTAHALSLPRASVSAAIQQLESSMSTRLLHRTTRQVRLTTDGAQLLDRIRLLLADAEDIDQLFNTGVHKISGRLNVDVPSRIARRLIAPALSSLFRCYPRLRLALGSTDRFVNLVQEGVDCAVRVGTLSDSSLVARPLGYITLINCAADSYLRDHGVPTTPEDLTHAHWSVGYTSSSTGRELPWEYLVSGNPELVTMPSRVIVNNIENYIACSLSGMGLIQVPRFEVQHLLDKGELTEVMPDFRASPMPMSIVYPHRRQRSRRVSAFIEWFEALMLPYLDA